MSSSTTYRRVESLPAEVQAEVDALLSTSSPNAKLLPALTADLVDGIGNAATAGLITPVDAEAFVQEINGAATLADLETIICELPLEAAGTLGLTTDTAGFAPTFVPDTILPDGTDTGGNDPDGTGSEDETIDPLRWQIKVVERRLEVSRCDAEALQLNVDDPLSRAADALAAASMAITSRHPELTEDHLSDAATALDEIDRQIETALTLIETRRYTISRAADVLREMGFSIESGDGSTLVARSGTGQHTRVTLGTDPQGGFQMITSVTDPADAVPVDHPEADDVCEPAVRTALEFHRSMERTDGLGLGRVTTDEHPRRGGVSVERPTSDAAAQPRQDSTTDRVRRRSARRQHRRTV